MHRYYTVSYVAYSIYEKPKFWSLSALKGSTVVESNLRLMLLQLIFFAAMDPFQVEVDLKVDIEHFGNH